MAKALMGHLGSDARLDPRLIADNRRLRQRVADLERLVTRLQSENDALTDVHAERLLRDVQPV